MRVPLGIQLGLAALLGLNPQFCGALLVQQALARCLGIQRSLRAGSRPLCLNFTGFRRTGSTGAERRGTVRARRLCMGGIGLWRRFFRLLLALRQILLMLRRAAAAQFFLARVFSLLQQRALLTRLPTGIAKAAADDKALVAGRLSNRQPLVNRGALFLEMLLVLCAFGSPVLPQRRAGQPCQQQDRAEEPMQKRLHVSPVSTTRRSRARNSRDCISFRRETVRGNSCTSGPSV